MTTDSAASVQGVALRVVKLDSAGAPLIGAKSAYVTTAFMSLGFTPEYTEGDEIEEKAADGTVCVYYKMPDVMKRVTLNLAICDPNPELTEILVGGTLLSAPAVATITNKALTTNVATITTASDHDFMPGDSVVVDCDDAVFDGTFTIIDTPLANTFTFALTHANVPSAVATGTVTPAVTGTVGWSAPATGAIPTPNGVGIEVWSRAIVGGRPASTNPYWRWVFPYAQLKLSGDRVLENGAMANTFEGYGLANSGFGTGPGEDWPFPTTSAYQYARDNTIPGVYGYLAIN